MEFTKPLHKYILEEASDSMNRSLGARPIENIISAKISPALTNLVIKNKNGGIVAGDKIKIEAYYIEENPKKIEHFFDVVLNKIQTLKWKLTDNAELHQIGCFGELDFFGIVKTKSEFELYQILSKKDDGNTDYYLGDLLKKSKKNTSELIDFANKLIIN